MLRKLCEEGDAARDPEGFADAAERLALAVGSIQTAAVEEASGRRSRELESQANTDTLTGLYNLRYLQRVMGQLVGYHQRYEHPFAMLLLDVDGLKRINDAHGHAAGDRVLVQVAMAVRRSVRTVDTPARLGGDEFIVLAPHQSAEHASVLAERLATAVEREAAPPDGPTVGVSIGVVACPEHGSEAEPLMELADQAMYRAKAAGTSVAVGERRPAGTTGRTALVDQARGAGRWPRPRCAWRPRAWPGCASCGCARSRSRGRACGPPPRSASRRPASGGSRAGARSGCARRPRA